MHLIETHAHLDDPRFAKDLDAVIARAGQAGVTRIITIGTSLESSRAAITLAERYASVYAAVGIHPSYVEEEKSEFFSALCSIATHPKVVAIGEIGIDFFHLPSNATDEIVLKIWRENQAKAFYQQLELACDLGLNVIIHQRDVAGASAAWEETLRILKPYTGKLRAVFHCFGGTPAQAKEVIAMGHLISFTGIITFKNAPTVRETGAAVPLDRFMIETDAPYLAPVPHRGERAEPAHVCLVAEKIAEIRGLSLEEVAKVTTASAEEFFRIL
ncbi:MAG: TatD family hydrolase [Chthoniobacterales bacterium]|nr:TatD family hydrolase [Chthoniobacterales bacterium]